MTTQSYHRVAPVSLQTDLAGAFTWSSGSGGRHPLIVIRVHTHTVVLQVERKLTEGHMFELVLMEVGPTPQTGVDHMGKALPARHLAERQRQIERETEKGREREETVS